MITCPKCRQQLVSSDDGYMCNGCNNHYLKKNGMYNFLNCDQSQADVVADFFPDESFDKLFRYEEEHFWFKAKKQILTDVLERYVQRDGRILDVGCGNGNITLHFRKNGWNVDCGDISAKGLNYCQKRCGDGQYYIFSLYDQVFQEEYDCVCAFDVIEHIEDDRLAIKNIHRALKKDGIIFVTVPAYMFLWSDNDVYANHKRRYERDGLMSRFREEGFEIVRLSYINTLIFPPIVLYRTLTKYLFKNVNKNKLASEVKVGKMLNTLLYKVIMFERVLLKKMDMPVGHTLMCVARKK